MIYDPWPPWWLLLTRLPQGLSTFLGGFLIWNLDNIYCHTITRWRHQIQLPLAVLLEGHAWWHLMTGIGKPPFDLGAAMYVFGT